MRIDYDLLTGWARASMSSPHGPILPAGYRQEMEHPQIGYSLVEAEERGYSSWRLLSGAGFLLAGVVLRRVLVWLLPSRSPEVFLQAAGKRCKRYTRLIFESEIAKNLPK